MPVRKVAMLTAGGLAPCLSSAVAALVETWSATDPRVEIIAYRHGFAGLLTGDAVTFDDRARAQVAALHNLGGSPIGNSRVKLTNAADCRARGLVGPDEDPLDVAARRLLADGIDVLHTIGGDDTSTMAAKLAAHLAEQGHDLTVVGLPKTIDNDIVPVAQSLGAATAASETARLARNIVSEHSSNPNMLLVHEVMGRNCGWLTAAAAEEYRRWATRVPAVPGILEPGRWDVHAVYIPEIPIAIDAEIDRLSGIMSHHGCVNIFLAEGAGAAEIIAAMELQGDDVPRDPFGHPRLDEINPGSWFAGQFAHRLGADKTLVAKSGYFARSAPAGHADRILIGQCAKVAVEAAIEQCPGLVGHDEGRSGELRVIEFERVAGGRRFDTSHAWFTSMLAEIGQATASGMSTAPAEQASMAIATPQPV